LGGVSLQADAPPSLKADVSSLPNGFFYENRGKFVIISINKTAMTISLMLTEPYLFFSTFGKKMPKQFKLELPWLQKTAPQTAI
jgi:hypothetical protein